ncbi:MAG: hypothetical protein AAB434_05780 [Planctomycetota bacterium]
MIFAEALARPLLVLHAVLAAATAGAVTHDLVFLRLAIRRGGRYVQVHRLFTHLALLLAGATMLVGSVVYPTYRIRVRAEFLEKANPAVPFVFDLKENLGTLVLAVLLAYVFLLRRQGLAEDRWIRATYGLLSWTAFLLVWFNLVCGLAVVMVRSV